MSDELKAAAERVRRMQTVGDIDAIYPGTKYPGMNLAGDKNMLAEAWLADHPADDDEPIDEAFLRSVGFVEHETPHSGPKLLIDGEANKFAMTLRNGGWTLEAVADYCGCHDWSGKTGMMCFVKTRGALRRLCAALGIPLKEQS